MYIMRAWLSTRNARWQVPYIYKCCILPLTSNFNQWDYIELSPRPIAIHILDKECEAVHCTGTGQDRPSMAPLSTRQETKRIDIPTSESPLPSFRNNLKAYNIPILSCCLYHRGYFISEPRVSKYILPYWQASPLFLFWEVMTTAVHFVPKFSDPFIMI